MPKTDTRLILHVAVAPRSKSNFYRTLEGGLGVLHATYETDLEPGTPVTVHLHLPGDIMLRRPAVVAYVREPRGDDWPGLALRFTEVDWKLRDRVNSFARFRKPLVLPERKRTHRRTAPSRSPRLPDGRRTSPDLARVDAARHRAPRAAE